MRRETKKATRFPGVMVVGESAYRIRGKRKDPKTGKVHEVDRVLTPTTDPPASSAAEAAQARASLLGEKQKPAGERTRLKDFATSWLLEHEKELAPSTVDRYASTIDNHIVPTLGEYFLDAVTHADVVTWRDAQTDAPSTVNSRLRVLKTMIADATVLHNLPRDPTLRVDALPEETVVLDDEEDEDGALLSPDELAAFLDSARKLTVAGEIAPMWYPLLAVLAYSAMRVGEGTALRWSDIDEALAIIRVRRAQWRGIIGLTKNKRRRAVPLVGPLAELLREHRRWLVATQHRGAASGWVFPAAKVRIQREDGTWPPVSTSSVRKPLMAVLKAVELEGRITTHGLRRTWNNILRQVTAGEVVRSITGHSTEAMTAHYSHVHQNEKAQAATRALSLVRAQPSEVGTLVGTGITSNG